MTTKQIEDVFLTREPIEEENIYNEMFQELKDEQTVHLQEALSSLNYHD